MYRQIIGMSMSRKTYIDNIYATAKILTDHIIKCVVYKNKTNSLNHWIHEISNFLSLPFRYTIKPNKGRLKYEEYEDEIFGYFGDESMDCEGALILFQSTVGKNYPEFDITDEIVDSLYQTVSRLKEIVIPLLVSGKIMNSNEVYQLISPVFAE